MKFLFLHPRKSILAAPNRSGDALTQSAGFTLVEILVGMAMALIGVVIMMQVTTAFEGQKRTTTGGDDAQNTGAIALYQLQRELRLAGYGIASPSLLGCALTLPNATTVTLLPATINPAGIAPMGTGANGRDAGTDSILLMYGNSNGSVEGITINSGAGPYAVQAPTSFAVGDFVMAARTVQPTPCSGANALVLTNVTAIAGNSISVGVGAAGLASALLFNLGQAPTFAGYLVRNGTLKRCDFRASDCTGGIDDDARWVPVANSIAALRLDHGRDTTAPVDGIVDTWDQTIAATTPVACGGVRISAVRVGLLARSGQFEREEITTGTVGKAPLPTWDGSVQFDLAANVAVEPNWKNYRYRVLQTVVPIRNVALVATTAGC